MFKLDIFESVCAYSKKWCSHEQIGGRLGYSIRGTLQSQAKAFVDFQHESRVIFDLVIRICACLLVY